MSDSDYSTPGYYVVADLPREKKSSLPQREETMESTLSNSPVYDVANIKPVRRDTVSPMTTVDNIHYRAVLPQQPQVSDHVFEDHKKMGKVNCKISLCFITATVAVASIVVLSIEFARLKSELASFKETTNSIQSEGRLENVNKTQELNNSLVMLFQQTRNNLQDLKHELSEVDQTQANRTQQLNVSVDMHYQQLDLNTEQLNTTIQTNFIQLTGDITTIESKTQFLFDYLQIGQSQDTPSPSCAVLSRSGYYWVRTSNGSAVRVYCDTTRSCGGVTGGWVRVAYLDKTNRSQISTCPSGLREHMFSERRTCRRDNTSAGCSSVRFTTHELSYSKVCGRITAFADGAPEGFMRTNETDINETYVDGVSLTHGAPRQHIWTFAATSSETNRCSCNNSNTAGTPPPEYVGNDYFCDTRFRESGTDRDLVLWQGTDCTSSNACCSFNNPPWFYKQLLQHTTDDIEMRVCRDEERSNEDVFIQIAEIYIQ